MNIILGGILDDFEGNEYDAQRPSLRKILEM